MHMSIDPVMATLAAGLGGSLLTGGAAFGLVAVQSRGARRAQVQSARGAAYSRLLSSSGLIVHSANAMHVTMRTRSGVFEGVDVLLRLKKPMDALDLDDFLRRDTAPLYDA